MKLKLMNFIKYNPVVFFLYNRLGSLFFRFIGIFFPIDQKKILFVSFGGKKYDDSPQAIYEKMITMKEFRGYKFVWAFTDTDKIVPGNPEIVKIDTFSYFRHALSSRFWITNVSVDRGMSFKKKKTICINSWHGTPIKKIQGEENSASGSRFKNEKEVFDLVCSQSEYDRTIFSRIFCVPKEQIILSDLPRNDMLLRYSEEDIANIKMKLNIPEEKTILLYMPTYREYLRDSSNAVLFNPPIDLQKWQRELGDKYILLFRAHYLVVKNMDIQDSDFVRDMSAYNQLSELYAISDIMISDYSSAFFDYSILERPELCFAYDFKEYEQYRGLYFGLDKLPCEIDYTEDGLISHIKHLDIEKARKRTAEFKKIYAPYAGHATDKVIDEMINRFMGGR